MNLSSLRHRQLNLILLAVVVGYISTTLLDLSLFSRAGGFTPIFTLLPGALVTCVSVGILKVLGVPVVVLLQGFSASSLWALLTVLSAAFTLSVYASIGWAASSFLVMATPLRSRSGRSSATAPLKF